MIVKNILAAKQGDVVTIDPTANLAAAVKLLIERHIGAVVILGADHRVIGILSERDIVRALAEHGPTVLSEPVSKVMTRDVKTCSEDDTIGDLMGRTTIMTTIVTVNPIVIASHSPARPDRVLFFLRFLFLEFSLRFSERGHA